MNKTLPAVLLSALFICCVAKARVFRNLDFEAAVLPGVTNLQEPKFQDLFPAWQPVIPPGYWAAVYYDIVMDSPAGYTLSDSAIEMQYGWAPSVVLSGRHSAILVVSAYQTNSLGLQQTGLVPVDAKTLRFAASPRSLMGARSDCWGIRLVINGETVATELMELTTDRALWNADVSQFQGKVVDLQILVWINSTKKPVLTYVLYTCAAVDDIVFSPEPLRRLETGTNKALVMWGERLEEPPLPVNATNLLMVSAGFLHKAGLGSDGQVFTWGDPTVVSAPPPPLSNVVAAAAGYAQTYALSDDGRVFVWPPNWPATTNQLPGISNAVAVSANGLLAFVLRADGTVAPVGTMDRNFWAFAPVARIPAYVPAGLTNVTAVAAGGLHGVALRRDGTVTAWVSAVWDPGFPYRPNALQTNVPPEATNIVAIAAGAFHSLALRGDGLVFAWGENDFGQTNVPPGLSNVFAIAAGSYHNLALRRDGTVVAWGDNVDGQTNVPAGLTNVVAITAGGSQSIAMLGHSPADARVSLTNYGLGDNGFTASVPTEAGRVYQLEYADEPGSPAWSALPLISGNGKTRVLSDSRTGVTRFYRVRKW